MPVLARLAAVLGQAGAQVFHLSVRYIRLAAGRGAHPVATFRVLHPSLNEQNLLANFVSGVAVFAEILVQYRAGSTALPYGPRPRLSAVKLTDFVELVSGARQCSPDTIADLVRRS